MFSGLSSIASGQVGADGRPLIEDVEKASKGSTSYRVEGHVEEEFFLGPQQFQFHMVAKSPALVRMETESSLFDELGVGPEVIYCDGRLGWGYRSKRNQYHKVEPDTDADSCGPNTLIAYERLTANLRSSRIRGADRITIDGQPRPCVVVEAPYRVLDVYVFMMARIVRLGRVSRTLCIDSSAHRVLRDRIEAEVGLGDKSVRFVQTIHYDRIESNPPLEATLFQFHPPVGASRWEPFRKPHQAPAVPPVPAQGGYPPAVLSDATPDYTAEAWDEGIQGEVILDAVIGPDGTTREFKIRKSLGYGLDERAIECVQKWRVRAATDNGRAVESHFTFRVPFNLPDDRPTRTDTHRAAAASRPWVAPRIPAVTLIRPTDHERFFHLVAINFQVASLCERIGPMAEGEQHFDGPRGLQVHTLRADCYNELAKRTQDGSLCDRIAPVRTDRLDGSEFGPKYCRAGIHGPTTAIVPHFMRAFAESMREIGYTVEDVLAWKSVADRYHGPAAAAYEAARKDGGFRERAKAGPSLDEPRTPGQSRPAQGIEFLYQRLAMDLNEAAFCGRISPNAVTVLYIEPPQSLRAHCYTGLANNNGDASLCQNVPAESTLPANAKYYSAERCREDATDAASHPPDRRNMAEAISFPSPEAVRSALLRIGYDKAYIAGLIPPPEEKDYWSFVSALLYSNRPADGERRAEFVRRVQRMP